MDTLRVKNWHEFQHYKDRSPAWIKLHKKTLDDFSFQRLPLASRALAPMIWLLASESSDGSLSYDLEEIAFRVHTTPREVEQGIKPLIEKGFLIVEHDASSSLAGCYVDASLEKEEEREEERDISSIEDDFAIWYEKFPNHVGKGQALKAYRAARKKVDAAILLDGIEKYRKIKPAYADWAHPSTWLNGERWADEAAADANPPAEDVAKAERIRADAEVNRRRIAAAAERERLAREARYGGDNPQALTDIPQFLDRRMAGAQ